MFNTTTYNAGCTGYNLMKPICIDACFNFPIPISGKTYYNSSFGDVMASFVVDAGDSVLGGNLITAGHSLLCGDVSINGFLSVGGTRISGLVSGPTGYTGWTGFTGCTGFTGYTGRTGAQGPAGTNGSNGGQGAQGPQGSAGTNGTNGSNGGAGSQGPQGPAGTNGTNGSNGSAGSQGSQGFQGPQGFTGFTGYTGYTGAQGSANSYLGTNNTWTGTNTFSYVGQQIKTGDTSGRSIQFGDSGSLVSDTTQNDNVCVGFNTMRNMTSGFANTSVGNRACSSMSTAQMNVAFGTEAIQYMGDFNNYNNVALGVQALKFYNGGSIDNVGIGYMAGGISNKGIQNVLIGSQVGTSDVVTSYTGGNNNVLIGALLASTSTARIYPKTGSNNTSIGFQNGFTNEASYSTAIGYNSGQYITGSHQVVVGSSTETFLVPASSSSFTNNVGIKTTSPSYPLDVNGNARIQSSLYVTSNIGIGTTSPSYPLDINGNARIQSSLYVTSNIGIGTTTPSVALEVNGKVFVSNGNTLADPSVGVNGGSGDRIVLWSGTSTTYPYSFGMNNSTMWYSVPTSCTHNFFCGGGSVFQLGYDSNLSNYQVRIPGSQCIEFGYGNTKETSAGKIGYGTFGTGSSLCIVGAGTTGTTRKVRIWDQLGINVTASSEQLIVDSPNNSTYAKFQNSTSGGWMTINISSSGSGYLSTNNAMNISSSSTLSCSATSNLWFNTAGSTRLYITSGGNVGIGNSSPSYALDVTGSGRITSDLYVTGTMSSGYCNASYITAYTYARLGNVLVLPNGYNDGNTGIWIEGRAQDGNSSGSYQGGFASWDGVGFRCTLDNVTRIVWSTRTGAQTVSSDYRLKKNIVTLDASYSVLKLRPVHYLTGCDDTEQIGFLAHEVQESLPILVSGVKDAVDASGNAVYQGLNYIGLVPILVNDIIKMNATIQTLQAQVAALQLRLSP